MSQSLASVSQGPVLVEVVEEQGEAREHRLGPWEGLESEGE